jgi:hypothetical protein
MSLVFALRESGSRADDGNGAPAAAARIEQLLIATRRRRPPRTDMTLGRSSLARLQSDATAELQ